MNTQNNPNQYPQQPGMYPFPVVPPQGQQPYMYPQPGQNPYYPYGEPPKEGKSVWGIVLIVLGILLTGGIALWWWNKNKKGSTAGQKNIRGLYDVQEETISRLNLTIAEQEIEIDRLNKKLKQAIDLIDPNGVWSDSKNDGIEKGKVAETLTDHQAFRDSFGLDLSREKNKIVVDWMNKAVDFLVEKKEYYPIQEVENQYKNDELSCKITFYFDTVKFNFEGKDETLIVSNYLSYEDFRNDFDKILKGYEAQKLLS